MKKIEIIKRAIAVAIAVALIVLVATFSMSLLGNPIDALKAKKSIKEYVAKNYDMEKINFASNKVYYEFKFGSYFMKLEDKNTLDTRFTVTYEKNKIYDDYEFRISCNALERLEKRYKEYVMEILKANSKYKIEDVFTFLKKESNVEPETPFDVNLDMFNDISIMVTYDKVTDLEDAAYKLIELDKIVQDNKLKCSDYTVECEFDDNENRISVSGITHEDVVNKNILEYIEKLYNEEEEGKGVIYIENGVLKNRINDIENKKDN